MRILIIVGGEIGYALCAALSSDHDVFLVDNGPGVAGRFAQIDSEFVEGSGTSPGVLRLAQVYRDDRDPGKHRTRVVRGGTDVELCAPPHREQDTADVGHVDRSVGSLEVLALLRPEVWRSAHWNGAS